MKNKLQCAMYDVQTRLRFFVVFICLFMGFPGWVFPGGNAEPEAEAPAAFAAAPVPPVISITPLLRAPASVVQGDVLRLVVQVPLSAAEQENLNEWDARLAFYTWFDGEQVSGVVAPASPSIREVAAELVDGTGKKVSSFSGFRYPLPDVADTWAVIGGISSTQQPGDYSLVISIVYDNGYRFMLWAPLTIESRVFVREDIPLNEAMTSLRADPDPRQAVEARELWALLSRVNLGAVYHTEKFILPVEEGFRETSFFGDRRTFLYSDGGRAHSIHNGIDYATPRGTPVHSSGAGRVVMAKSRIITGVSIVIEHLPGVYSLYFHLDTLNVREGQMVTAGEKIGESGFTGLSTGPHLHWEVRVAGNAVEPKNLLETPFIQTTLEP